MLSKNSLPPTTAIVMGFPCQDLSNAGQTAGLEGLALKGRAAALPHMLPHAAAVLSHTHGLRSLQLELTDLLRGGTRSRLFFEGVRLLVSLKALPALIVLGTVGISCLDPVA